MSIPWQIRNGSSGHMRKAFDEIVNTRRGLRGFYLGWRPLVMRDVIGYSLLYTVFFYAKKQKDLPIWAAGGISGISFYLSTLPIDRVKTIMMTQDTSKPQYRNASHCFVDIVKREGIRGL